MVEKGGDVARDSETGMEEIGICLTLTNIKSRKGGVNMRSSLLHSKELLAIIVAVGFVLSLGLSQALGVEKVEKMSDKKAEKMLFQGVDKMMSGKKMLVTGLGKQKLGKDPKLAGGIKMLTEGEKMAVEGKKLMKAKSEKEKMEGKDAIMNELKARGMMQEGKLQEGEKILKQGDMKMLEGKNDMERPLD
jgi:hypothetical protein